MTRLISGSLARYSPYALMRRLDRSVIAAVFLVSLSFGLAPAIAAENGETTATADKGKDITTIRILYARELLEKLPPLSLLDLPPADDGIGGAKLAIDDNNTTGRFIKQHFELVQVEDKDAKALLAKVIAEVEKGIGFIVADMSADTLLATADALKEKNALIFNAGTHDERVREEQCRTNVKHTAPSRAMLADALTQYLVWKRWRKWFVIVGQQPNDKLMLEAFRRSGKRFGAKIVEERVFEYDAGSRRADGGFEQMQQQIPTFTQKAEDHDVVVVIDDGGIIGEYFPYRVWNPRPVVGTAGLYPTTWHPAVEMWGGTQFQNRFIRMNNRRMRPLDYNVWMAVRSVGEAATRKNSGDPAELISYLRSPEFELAAFKGRKLTYRSWNGQLRQPILLTTGKLHVTVSPQPGFLHQLTELDTLGLDRPETRCKGYEK